MIGLVSDDPRVDVRIALRAARTALPVAAEERQRVLAVGVLTCERMLDRLDGRPPGTLESASRAALDTAPRAEAWARHFGRDEEPSLKPFRRRAAPTIVSCATRGIAEACHPGADERLHDLLVDTIQECTDLIRTAPPVVHPPAPIRFSSAARGRR